MNSMNRIKILKKIDDTRLALLKAKLAVSRTSLQILEQPPNKQLSLSLREQKIEARLLDVELRQLRRDLSLARGASYVY